MEATEQISNSGNSGAFTPAARVPAGVQPGRIVNYVMRDGLTIRPAIILAVVSELVSLCVFHDGKGDLMNFPLPLLAGPSGHLPDNTAIMVAGFDDKCLRPGTWHWPVKQAVMASSVDQGALELQVTGLMNSVLEQFKAEILSLVNAKCAALADSVSDSLEGHDAKVVASLGETLDRIVINVAKRAADTVTLIEENNLGSSVAAGALLGSGASQVGGEPAESKVAEAGQEPPLPPVPGTAS